MINFNDWDDYVPIGSGDLEIPKLDNIIHLNELEFNSISDDIEFENYSEVLYDEEFVRFIKCETYENIILYKLSNSSEIFLVVKGDRMKILYIYQCSEYYIDDNKITFNGWNYNTIFNINTFEHKNINIR